MTSSCSWSRATSSCTRRSRASRSGSRSAAGTPRICRWEAPTGSRERARRPSTRSSASPPGTSRGDDGSLASRDAPRRDPREPRARRGRRRSASSRWCRLLLRAGPPGDQPGRGRRAGLPLRGGRPRHPSPRGGGARLSRGLASRGTHDPVRVSLRGRPQDHAARPGRRSVDAGGRRGLGGRCARRGGVGARRRARARRRTARAAVGAHGPGPQARAGRAGDRAARHARPARLGRTGRPEALRARHRAEAQRRGGGDPLRRHGRARAPRPRRPRGDPHARLAGRRDRQRRRDGPRRRGAGGRPRGSDRSRRLVPVAYAVERLRGATPREAGLAASRFVSTIIAR